MHGYLSATTFADAQVGRVLGALDKSGQADNTIVVLWTDHGWHLGEKKHWRKFTLWEASARTPLMFVVPKGLAKALPSGTRADVRLDQPVGLIDIYPTLLDLCGLAANSANEGRSLVPLLADKIPSGIDPPSPRTGETTTGCARRAGDTSATPSAARNCMTTRPTRTSGAISPVTQSTPS